MNANEARASRIDAEEYQMFVQENDVVSDSARSAMQFDNSLDNRKTIRLQNIIAGHESLF